MQKWPSFQLQNDLKSSTFSWLTCINFLLTLHVWTHNQSTLVSSIYTFFFICNFGPSVPRYVLSLLSLILSPSSTTSGPSVVFPLRPSAGIYRQPLSAPALLPSMCLRTSKRFARPQAIHSQWTANGLLLTTVETYNMPGNRGNHSGGDGPLAIDTHPPTRLESVMCDLHPWFLSKRLHAFQRLSFLKIRCICRSALWRTPVHGGERCKISNTE